jgi:6-phosphofructokinase
MTVLLRPARICTCSLCLRIDCKMCVCNVHVDIKRSAVSSQRVFVVEVMGSYCGYLALMSGLAGGAERVYLHEVSIVRHWRG